MPRIAGSPEGEADRGEKTTPGLLLRCVHLAVLSSLAIAQPLLDLLARHPEFFVAQGTRRDGIFILVAALLVVPALPFVAVESMILRFPRKLQETAHVVFVWFFALVLALLMVKRFGELSLWVAMVSAAVMALVAAVVYLKSQTARSLVTLMAIGLIVIPAGFLIKVRASGLMDPSQFSGRQIAEISSEDPIVFIVFDEFSTPVLLDEHGLINRVRYPNIAGLADTATWYPKAVTIAQFTMVAVPAILSGVRPQPGQLPTFEAHPENLFTLFGGTYDVWALETMTSMCPEELNRRGTTSETPSEKAIAVASDLWIVFLHLLSPDSVVDRLPPISNTWGAFGDRASVRGPEKPVSSDKARGGGNVGAREVRSDRRGRVEEFMGALQECGDQELYFIHIMLPHGPWDLLPEGQRYPAERGVIWGVDRKDNSWTDDEFLPMQAYQRYILQTMYVDRFVGEMRRTLENLGVFDRALVVLVADHGVSFEPGQLRRHANLENAHEILPIPLVIKAPHQREAKIVDRLVSILDVMPTIAHLMGVGSAWEMDGISQTAEDVDTHHPIEFAFPGGGLYEIELGHLDGMDEVIDRKLRVFGNGSDPLRLYRIGRYPGAIGRRVSDFSIEEPMGWVLTIDDEGMYVGVDLKSSTLPVFVQGSINAGREDKERPNLAVVVNGRIGAVVPTHPDADAEERFTALIPPWFLRQGDNALDVYFVDGAREAPVLHPLTGH